MVSIADPAVAQGFPGAAQTVIEDAGSGATHARTFVRAKHSGILSGRWTRPRSHRADDILGMLPRGHSVPAGHGAQEPDARESEERTALQRPLALTAERVEGPPKVFGGALRGRAWSGTGMACSCGADRRKRRLNRRQRSGVIGPAHRTAWLWHCSRPGTRSEAKGVGELS